MGTSRGLSSFLVKILQWNVSLTILLFFLREAHRSIVSIRDYRRLAHLAFFSLWTASQQEAVRVAGRRSNVWIQTVSMSIQKWEPLWKNPPGYTRQGMFWTSEHTSALANGTNLLRKVFSLLLVEKLTGCKLQPVTIRPHVPNFEIRSLAAWKTRGSCWES